MLPRGVLTPAAVGIFVAASAGVFVLAAAMLNPLCLALSPLALANYRKMVEVVDWS